MTATPAVDGDLLLPSPLSGVLVGYGRVSTREQNLARQEAALTAAGCAKCIFDKASGKNADRPGLTDAFAYLRPGDALTVVSLDRLGRSLEDLITIVSQPKCEGVGFSPCTRSWTPPQPAACSSSTSSPPWPSSSARPSSPTPTRAWPPPQQLGRPPAMTPEKIAYALALLAEPDRSLSAIAKLLRVSRTTLYKALSELLTPEQAKLRRGMQLAALPPDQRALPSVEAYDQLLSQDRR